MGDKVNAVKRPTDGKDTKDSPAKIAHIESVGSMSHGVALKGEREELQDSHLRIDDFHGELNFLSDPEALKSSSFYCLCDGHSGSRAADVVIKTLPLKLTENLQRNKKNPSLSEVESEIKRATIDSYKQIDEDFLKKASENKPPWKDGTTVTNVLILNKFLYVANVGDSRAVLYRRNTRDNEEKSEYLQPIPLTRDHSPALYEERQRIQKAGGNVKDGRILGVIEVSRSIGDGPYKSHGLTCVPDVKRLLLTGKDEFLILACDGLWKVIEPSEVASILEDLSKKTPFDLHKIASQQLAASALRKLSGDNVTVIVIDLRALTKTF